MLELIFMYGYPASGKTTYAKDLAAKNPDYIYLAADDIREELYGSQDHFGNPEDIYTVLLSRMMKHLRQGHSVIYDACNLYRQFRMDYLVPIKEAGIQCSKTLIRLNTTKESCFKNHEVRGRNFDIKKISHYFNIDEFPRVDEGWDNIYDVPDHRLPSKKLYLSSPLCFMDGCKAVIDACEYFRHLGYSVFLPLEHKFHNPYPAADFNLSRAVFELNTKAIQDADIVVCVKDRSQTTINADWVAGYACATKKPVLVVELPGTRPMSLLLANSCHAALKGFEALRDYDLNSLVQAPDAEEGQN